MKSYIAIMTIALLVCYGEVNATDHHGQPIDPDYTEKSSELPPAYLAEVFQARRERILEKMQGDVAIFSTSDPQNFYYGTGFDQAPAIAVLSPDSEHPFTLFIRHANPTMVLWDGPRYTKKEAKEIFGADEVYLLHEFDEIIPQLVRDAKSVSLLFGDEFIKETLENRVPPQSNFLIHTDLSTIFNEMRVIKDPWEQDLLTHSVDVTSRAHQRALKHIRPGKYEYEIKAEIEYVFQKNGCGTGFNSIVASGPNATFLHYPMYDRQLQDGDLILIDVGAKCNHYTADVTRTYPVNGKFSPEQRELYQLVLDAQLASIEMMKPGVGTLEPHHRATEIILEGLYELGLITDLDSWWQRRFYIHYAGLHYIGLHVHDVGHFADIVRSDRDQYVLNTEIKGRPMEPGMVLTNEPGIYLVEDRLDHLNELFGRDVDHAELQRFEWAVRPTYEKYSGIGIRIEDDVLITESGHKILSDSAPKSIEEIESIMSQQSDK